MLPTCLSRYSNLFSVVGQYFLNDALSQLEPKTRKNKGIYFSNMTVRVMMVRIVTIHTVGLLYRSPPAEDRLHDFPSPVGENRQQCITKLQSERSVYSSKVKS